MLKKRQGLNLKYNIIGDGPLIGDLKYIVNKMMLNNVVHFLGPKEQEEIIDLLQQSHIFLCPSIAEALPVSIMEAQAVGLPVVATDVGSVSQIVLDGKSGFLVPARNVDALTERLLYLIDHPEICIQMGRHGRNNVEIHFDIDKLNDRLVQIYERLLA